MYSATFRKNVLRASCSSLVPSVDLSLECQERGRRKGGDRAGCGLNMDLLKTRAFRPRFEAYLIRSVKFVLVLCREAKEIFDHPVVHL